MFDVYVPKPLRLEARLKGKVSRTLFNEEWQKRPTSFGFELRFELRKMSLERTFPPG